MTSNLEGLRVMTKCRIGQRLLSYLRSGFFRKPISEEDPTNARFREDIQYINLITQEVLRVSDRGRAVLIGAELDRYLKLLLQEYFLPQLSKSDKLLEGSGPLSAFSARIEVLYRLGLLHPDWHHDLGIISRIRNKFAHGEVGMTLNEQSVSALCFNLIAGERWIQNNRKLDPTYPDTPQNRFVSSYVTLLGHLCIVRKGLKCAPAVWKSYKEESVILPVFPLTPK